MTKPRAFRLGERPSAMLAAGTAAIITTVVLVTAGSAQAPPTSLHLVSKPQKGVGFSPKHAPHQGDRVGFGSRVSGDDSGTSRGVCTVIGKPALLCTLQVQLSKGTLTAQGSLPQRARNRPVAITGGTGAYNGARGTALVTDVNPNTTNINITLLP